MQDSHLNFAIYNSQDVYLFLVLVRQPQDRGQKVNHES